MISFTTSGSTKRTSDFLKRIRSRDLYSSIDVLARKGVEALSAATPVETGLTSASWSYEIEIKDGITTITWLNNHVESGVNVAIILQYGHGTGTGGYVAGRDYINPAIKPIFDQIADDVWKKVTLA